MNTKEAKEILKQLLPQKANVCLPHFKHGSMEVREFAKGYLEAHKKVHVLMVKLKKTRDIMYENIYDAGGWIKNLDEILNQWEKEV